MSLSRYLVILPLLCLSAYAQSNNLDDTVINVGHDVVTPEESTQAIKPAQLDESAQNTNKNQIDAPPEQEKVHTIKISITELKKNPELLQKSLNTSIIINNIKYVKLLLPMYQQVPNPDNILILYAEAVIAKDEGDYSTAIDKYRQIIAQRPELNPVRLQLAQTLFADEQDTASLDQFEKLRSSNGLPPVVSGVVDQYIDALHNRNSWNVNGNLQYIQESNVNQGTNQTTYGLWQINKKPQKGHGVSYGLSLDKFQPIKPHWGITPKFNVYGKYYWDNHKFNDLTARIGLGMAYRSNTTEASITPFIEREWYGNKPFAIRPGIGAQFSHWLSPRWQFLLSGELSHKWQDSYLYLRGNTAYVSSSIFYVHSPQQYWLFGINYLRSLAEDDSDSYRRSGGRLLWGQEWGKGISTQVQLALGRVNYDGKDILQILRQDTQYNIISSIWSRSLHFYGLTPRLTFVWQKRRSNHFMYNFHNSQVFIEVSKKF